MSDYYEKMFGIKKGKAKEYVEKMTGSGEPSRSIIPSQPIMPEIVGRIEDPLPPPVMPPGYEHSIGASSARGDLCDQLWDQRMLRRLDDARQTGETIVEINEVVARSSGRIKARSMEVSLTFGDELDLGSLLKGCLAILDFTRNKHRPEDVLASIAPPPRPRMALPAPPARRLPRQAT